VYTLFVPKRNEQFCALGDCGTKAKSVNETVNTTMTGIMTSNAQSCGASTGVNHLDAGGDITISNIKQDYMN
jgi:hypothetical protein